LTRTAWRCSPMVVTTWIRAYHPDWLKPAPGISSWPWPAGRGCPRCATTSRPVADS
jgi:hypothetical protein